MGAGNAVLIGLRGFAVLIALAVVGLGAWSKVIIHDAEVRGDLVLDLAGLPADREEAWRSYIDDAVNSQTRIWIAIAAGSFTALATILIILSQKLERFHMTPYLQHPLELLCTLAMTAAFASTLTLALNLTPYDTPLLSTSNSADLTSFHMLLALTKGYAIAAGTGAFVLLCTSASALIHTCHRARNAKPCSFEPTASALGMGHGYQAVVPRTSRGPVPTLYDPQKPIPAELVQMQGGNDEEKGFANAGAEMGRRESVARSEGEGISGPLGLKRPEEVAQMRPARPWSEMPKRR